MQSDLEWLEPDRTDIAHTWLEIDKKRKENVFTCAVDGHATCTYAA